MKEVWLICLLFLSLIIEIHSQDDDYDTDPEEAVNADYAAPNEPEFFKNAFVENTVPGSRDGGGMWGNYLQLMPFGGPPPSLYSLPAASPSMNYGTRSNGFESKPFNDDFFADFDKPHGGRSKDSDSFDSSPPPFKGRSKSMSGGYPGAGAYGQQQPMFNYPMQGASPYGHPFQAGRFNPLQNGAPYHPVGAHLFPHAQRNKNNDNFDRELKEMGIDLTEFGLGGGSLEEEKKKSKEKKKRKEKPSKVRPLFPSFLSPIKPTSTEAPVVTQNQYLKSHVENDILNFGVNMHDFGIKEHKLEKQVYGDNRYQYPMQANQNIGGLSGYGHGQIGNPMGNSMNNQMSGQSTGYRDQSNLNDELDFKGLNQQINQYSDNKINSLLKLNPAADQQTTSGMMPVLNSNIYNTLNPVFTAIDANPLNTLNANDIAAINLLENGLTDLDSFSGKAHEYRTNEHNSMHEKGSNRPPPDNINENFKAFVPTVASKGGHEKRPKFIEDDPFFKDKKPKKEDEEEEDNENNDKYDSEPKRTRGRKGQLDDHNYDYHKYFFF